MPLTRFERGRTYSWELILETLRPWGYRQLKRGALAVPGDPGLPVFVFPTEGHEKYRNAHERAKRTVQYQVNPDRPDLNQRIRESESGLEVGLFYRVEGGDFTYLGPARFRGASGDFFELRY